MVLHVGSHCLPLSHWKGHLKTFSSILFLRPDSECTENPTYQESYWFLNVIWKPLKLPKIIYSISCSKLIWLCGFLFKYQKLTFKWFQKRSSRLPAYLARYLFPLLKWTTLDLLFYIFTYETTKVSWVYITFSTHSTLQK